MNLHGRLLLIGCFILLNTAAQEVHHFTKGLVAFIPSRYGREALYTDGLAYQLYTGTLKTPAEGAVWTGTTGGGQPVTWQAVTGDSLNRLFLRGQGRGQGQAFGRSGYMYLTYTAAEERPALLNIRGNSGLYFNGEPHAGDPYNSGWLHLPVKLKKGLNELYVRGTFVTASLTFPDKPVQLMADDPTVPSIVLNNPNDQLQAAVVVVNHSDKPLGGLQLRSNTSGKTALTGLPVVPPRSTRKVAFRLDGSAVTAPGRVVCSLQLLAKGQLQDTASIVVEVVRPSEKYSSTFISNIDGSLQYYAVAPQTTGQQKGAALFFSVHGAGVEAIGQARAYGSKDWGTLVAPTNRRPRGFNWEDWGRLDALEVLGLARQRFQPHPQQIYLTGHSMGGHGTWFLGATYPDKWAAIAPCAGYPTLKGYGSADGLIPDSGATAMEQLLLRTSNQSDVIRLASNYKPLGVYVFHGDADRTVPVTYARQMRKVLGDFHTDLSYYEYPGGSHWFGDISVDWKPIFDFFSWHSRPLDTAVQSIDFTTANPGISSSYYWAAVLQQERPLEYSRIQLQRNRAAGTITGTTSNVQLLQLDLKNFNPGTRLQLTLDGAQAISYTTASAGDSLVLKRENGQWTVARHPGLRQKGPHRYGTFKDAFNNRMVFVYGTAGTAEENAWSLGKARYDAETWYYRGNGAVDLVADRDFSPAQYKDRGVILYGNKTTNRAWKSLLNDCPIQVERNGITAGGKKWQGDDLGAYFVWPLAGSDIASVGVVSGTGLKGMKAANANQYFAGASGFPDFMIYSIDMLQTGAGGVKMAGFFNNNWQLEETGYIQN